MDKVNDIIKVLKVVFSVLLGGITKLMGGDDNLIMLMYTLVLFDLVFGATKGAKENKFSSSVLFWGVINKAVMFIVVAIMYRVDIALHINILRNSFIVWFCLCDGASIIENTAVIGVPWPDGLLKTLIQVRKGFSINISKIVKQIIENYGVEKAEEKESEQ